MAEELLTTDTNSEETNIDPIAELSSKLETIESTFQEKLNEKESKIAELTESIEKQRARRKSAERKLKDKSVNSDEDMDVDTPDDYSANDFDPRSEMEKLREEMLFIRENPEYSKDDISKVQQLSKEKGINLSDAKIFYEYGRLNDPQLKAQSEQAKL